MLSCRQVCGSLDKLPPMWLQRFIVFTLRQVCGSKEGYSWVNPGMIVTYLSIGVKISICPLWDRCVDPKMHYVLLGTGMWIRG